ncbi:MAG TPA: hypothetical protein VGF07_02035 [Stellaceae bacterium]|jgi:hypothetical protein
MTLFTICESVALDLGVNLPQPPVYGSRVPAAQRLYAQARRAAVSLWRRAPWVELVTEYNFTASGVSDYPLPDDFGWMVDDTLWERSRYWALRGAMSPQKWQVYKSSIYGRATIWRRWRIRLPSGAGAGSPAMFSIDPPIAATDSTSQFVFEYVSKNWCVSNVAGQPQVMASDWTSDNDESLLDEWLIELDTRWRMLRRLGLAYDDEQDEAEREIDKAVARNGGGAILDLVPSNKRDDFIGQYTLGAFPPVPPADPAAGIAAARSALRPPPAPLAFAAPAPLVGGGESGVLPPAAPRRRRAPAPGIRAATPQPPTAPFSPPVPPMSTAAVAAPVAAIVAGVPEQRGFAPAFQMPVAAGPASALPPPPAPSVPPAPRRPRLRQPPMSDC